MMISQCHLGTGALDESRTVDTGDRSSSKHMWNSSTNGYDDTVFFVFLTHCPSKMKVETWSQSHMYSNASQTLCCEDEVAGL